jgi:hypothetical protein
MGHCTDCYGSSVVAPCSDQGCLSTNFAKCITYSGIDLFCATGAVGSISVGGTAVVPGTTTTHSNVSGTNISGTGTGATFDIVRTAGSNTYSVVVANRGSGYAALNQILIPGTSVGGASPANDITITISTLNAVIASGSNLDTIITTFHNALCSGISGAGGLDYSGLNYSCLRLGGTLTGIGTPITTEPQFVESSSAALCSLSTTLQDYDGQIILNSIEGDLPGLPATYNLDQYLTSLTAYVNTIASYVEMDNVLANPCVSYAFTTKPTTDLVSDYFNWITTNMCGMYTTLNGNLTTTTTTANNLKTYIAGAGTVPSVVDTSTITGGSSTSTAAAAITLLVAQVTSINNTLLSVPSSTFALTWATCFPGTFPSNSVFANQTWNFSNTAASLQTQLDRIVTVLSRLNIKFDTTYFTVNSASSCGALITLASGVAFTPASLNAAVINDLGDVTTASLANGDFLSYETGVWKNKVVTVKVNGSTASVTKTIAAGEVSFDLALTNSTPSVVPLTPNNTAEYTVANAVRFPLGAQPVPYAVKHGEMVTLHGVFQIIPVGGGLSWSHLGAKIIANLPLDVRPTGPVYFNAELYIKIGSAYSPNYTRATGQIDPTGDLSLILMNPAGTLNLTTADLIEVVIGGVTFAI